MSRALTVGDDYFIPCPSCSKRMNVGSVTQSGLLLAGYVGKCEHCQEDFEIARIDYIPNVWVKKHVHLRAVQENVSA
jgi:hypothetical protein